MSKRCRRATRLVLIAASIALVATAALFVTNRFRWLLVSHTTASEFRNLTVSNGAVWYGWALVPASPDTRGWEAAAFGRTTPQDTNFDPVQWRPVLRSKAKNFVVVVPLWMIALPFAAIAAWSLACLRQRAGHCECGYSLTGLSVQTPCPECGRTRTSSE